MKISTVKKLVAMAVCASMCILALAGCGSNASAAKDDGGITVSASSDMKVVPDKARMNFSVVTEDKDAETCRSNNAEDVNAVIEALKKLGVEETSIQTSYSNLSPRYGSRVTTAAKTEGSSEDAEDAVYDDWAITGYEMTTSLQVSDLDIDNVGTVEQACVAAGANQTDGVQYYASNYDEAYNEALAKALETAKGKADGIAAATGVALGKVTNVSEGYQDTSLRYVDSYKTMAMDADVAEEAAGAVANTMPGQVNITAEVTVTYAIG